MPELIYKICSSTDWAAAQPAGSYPGSAKDREDGFIHFSTAEQLPGTLAKYYAEVKELMLVAVKEAALGEALRYEPSRDNALFPHLYAELSLSAVQWSAPITKGSDGVFVLPKECV